MRFFPAMTILTCIKTEKFRKCATILILLCLVVTLGLLPFSDFYGHRKNHALLTVETMLYAKFGHSLSDQFMKNDLSNDDYLHYVRTLIAQPSKSIERSSKLLSPQDAQAVNGRAVDKRLKGRRRGFFVECGAGDGFTFSQSLFLELERDWTGLLVEANDEYFKELLQLNRQAFVFGGCLSNERQPQYLEFTASGHMGGFESFMNQQQRSWAQTGTEQRYRVTCFPLMDLLKAIDVDHVDFFSLDTQGGELQILKTIDFRSVRIDILIIEVENSNQSLLRQQRDEMRKFFNLTGLYKEVRAPHTRDLVFERIDLK